MATFPMSVTDALAEAVLALDGIEQVFLRPLRPDDPHASAGISEINVVPAETEISGGFGEPTLETYLFGIETLLKHSNEEDGRRESAKLARSIRSMLYRDTTLQVRLRGLVDESDGVTERTQRYGYRQQRYASNDVGRGNFIRASTTEFWLQTETV